jgi:hypothetical protein
MTRKRQLDKNITELDGTAKETKLCKRRQETGSERQDRKKENTRM